MRVNENLSFLTLLKKHKTITFSHVEYRICISKSDKFTMYDLKSINRLKFPHFDESKISISMFNNDEHYDLEINTFPRGSSIINERHFITICGIDKEASMKEVYEKLHDYLGNCRKKLNLIISHFAFGTKQDDGPTKKEVKDFINEVLYRMNNGDIMWFLPKLSITKQGEYHLKGKLINLKPFLKRFKTLTFRGGFSAIWWTDRESLAKGLGINENSSEPQTKICGELIEVDGKWILDCDLNLQKSD